MDLSGEDALYFGDGTVDEFSDYCASSSDDEATRASDMNEGGEDDVAKDKAEADEAEKAQKEGEERKKRRRIGLGLAPEDPDELPAADVDPLFDDEADEKDFMWVEKNLRDKRGLVKQDDGKMVALPELVKDGTDAVLNCPCCFMVVSMDCQRHTKFTNQWRAMFVKNCRVVEDECLKFPVDELSATNECKYETFKPVHCENCDTELGVMDEDAVYHFFNVFPGDF